jgi:hypothetical protein
LQQFFIQGFVLRHDRRDGKCLLGALAALLATAPTYSMPFLPSPGAIMSFQY